MSNFDFNSAGEQRSFDVIPANTIVTLQMTITPGGAGEDGWLKQSADGASKGLDCEFVVVTEGAYHKRKLWHWFTIEGTKPGHAEAGEISRKPCGRFSKVRVASGRTIRAKPRRRRVRSRAGAISTSSVSSPALVCARRKTAMRPRTPSWT